MLYRRELERKFVVDEEKSLKELDRDICAILQDHDPYRATSYDRFWRHPTVDFIRLRENSSELTVKVTDKGTILDRIEENVVVDDLKTAARFANLLFGDPVILVKTFSVWNTKLPGAPAPGTVCLYQVKGDSRVFLEVEASDLETVDAMTVFVDKYFDLTIETRSLFQIFFPEVP
jgi:hypothetical protein